MIKKVREFIRSSLFLNVIISIVYKFINPDKDTVFLHPSDGCWLSYNFSAGYKMFYPYPRGIFHIADRSNEKISNKYMKEGFIQVEDGDTVIDIGAFAGEFSLGVTETAGRIIACEPSPRTVHCLLKNTKNHSEITVVSAIVGNSNAIETLQFSYDPTDNSILDVDSEAKKVSLGIPSVRVNNIIDIYDIDSVDFLKVEAEGAEPEVLAGIGELPVKKVAVDAGAERYGERTVPQVTSILTDAGFRVQSEEGMVYAMKKN